MERGESMERGTWRKRRHLVRSKARLAGWDEEERGECTLSIKWIMGR